MAFIDKLFDTNFLEYASYVIKDRAIPHISDGLKPVQRRILHSLREMDDGKFNKVANVVGNTMKYHPHGDASIYSALVVLANKDLFIEKQGNFGNIFTGDEASAARYIECRLLPLSHEALFNPDITEYMDSYDGRNKEPIVFPAKIPVLLAQGAEGIAVGMATKVLPHNLIELMQAQIAQLRGEGFYLYPDFPTGGTMDVSEYCDGAGKVVVRAKFTVPDQKRIVITEVPFGTTTDSLITSIENAAKKNKLKIASISDFTAEAVEIEIKLAKGVLAKDTIDALFAFTDCEQSISSNITVIHDDNKPRVMTVHEIIEYNTNRLVEILRAELELELKKLRDTLHARTLERIFIENRIYKRIEEMNTQETVVKAVLDGLAPFEPEIRREVTNEDVDRLLKIQIRRISLYDINKAKKEVREIQARIKEIKHSLENMVDFSISWLEKMIEKYTPLYPRRTEVSSFHKVDVREAARRDLALRYNSDTGYIGFEVEGDELFKVSQYDRVLIIKKTGEYSVIDAPGKLFIDRGMLYCGFVDKDIVFNIVYREKKTDYPIVKRCNIASFILGKVYELLPDNAAAVRLTTDSAKSVLVKYKPKPRMKVAEETFRLEDFPVRGAKAKGLRLSSKAAQGFRFVKEGNGNGDVTNGDDSDNGDNGGGEPTLFTQAAPDAPPAPVATPAVTQTEKPAASPKKTDQIDLEFDD